jgi:uncharacterized membrane protein
MTLKQNAVLVGAAAVSTMLAAELALADDATYTPIPGYDAASTVTRDGSVVGLFSPFAAQAALWSADSGIFATINDIDQLGGITDDGQMIGGTFYPEAGDPPPEYAGRWTEAGGWENLGYLELGNCDANFSHGYDISGDGSVVVGLAWEGCAGRAHRWTQGIGMEMLPQEDYERSARANTVSGDGTIIGGWAGTDASDRCPSYWLADSTQVMPWPETGGEIWDMNSDGSVMIGWMWGPTNGFYEAVRYEPGGEPQFLGILPGGFDWTSQAFGMSESGNTIVGNAGSFWDGYYAWIWKPDLGMMDLKDYLISLRVQGLDDLFFENAYAVSADGSVIVGNTFDPFTWARQAFVVTIPAERHEVTIEVLGSVSYNSITSGPFAGAIVGDPVHMTFDVDALTGDGWDPDHFLTYPILEGTHVLTIADGEDGLAGSPAFGVQNDYPVVDGFFIFDSPTVWGYWMGWEMHGNNGDIIPSTDILDCFGEYSMADGWEDVEWYLFGGDGELYIEWTGMTISEPEPADPCPADINDDSTVDVFDLLDLLDAWGSPGGSADLNGDGVVDVFDLLELLDAWGPC